MLCAFGFLGLEQEEAFSEEVKVKLASSTDCLLMYYLLGPVPLFLLGIVCPSQVCSRKVPLRIPGRVMRAGSNPRRSHETALMVEPTVHLVWSHESGNSGNSGFFPFAWGWGWSCTPGNFDNQLFWVRREGSRAYINSFDEGTLGVLLGSKLAFNWECRGA